MPWVQRDQEPPTPRDWQRTQHRRRLTEARHALGDDATAERIAEHLGVSPRTVRRWQEMTG